MESQFGKFQLYRHIGGGRLSQVYQVTPPGIVDGLGRENVVLKRVDPSVIDEPAFVQLVVREAGVLTRLSHASLCRCHELGVIDGSAFLTLNMVDGCTLRAFLKWLTRMSVRLPFSAVLALGYQLAGALDYLHRGCLEPLVHLDLSPQNVMISRHGDIKLIDFGLARYLDGHNPPPLGGRIAGTVGYMSPEQANGADITARADQYGLGILLWEMLAGARLFRGNTPETWARMRSGAVPAPPQPLSRLPQPVVDLVYRLLRPSPDKRFKHLGMALDDFKRCSPAPLSGQQVLGKLVHRLMSTPSFDPFDNTMNRGAAPTPPADIPMGEAEEEEGSYAELAIEVDQGMGSPASQVRGVLPAEADNLPESPFLEN